MGIAQESILKCVYIVNILRYFSVKKGQNAIFLYIITGAGGRDLLDIDIQQLNLQLKFWKTKLKKSFKNEYGRKKLKTDN